MIRWSEVTIKSTGKRVRYEYRDTWGKRQYSFDGGQSWNDSKVRAYGDAAQSGKLIVVRVEGEERGMRCRR